MTVEPNIIATGDLWLQESLRAACRPTDIRCEIGNSALSDPIHLEMRKSIMLKMFRAARLTLRWVASLAFVATLFAGEATCQAERRIGHSACCGRQDVILIRGGAGYWPGAKAMSDYFHQLGYAPTIIQHWEYATVADEIAAAVQNGRMAGGVVIVGYSSGADYACLLAKRLNTYGVRVETMILVESTFGFPVPENVDYVVNYYESRRFDFIPAFRGVAVAARSPHTQVYNIDVGQRPDLGILAQRNHFTLANSPVLHQLAGNVVASRQPAVIQDRSASYSTYANAPQTPVRR